MKAFYFDGQTSRRHRVTLHVEAGELRFNGPDGERRIPAGEIVLNEPLGDAETCVLRFPAGDCCEVANGRDLKALLEELGRGELSPSVRERLLRRKGVTLAVVLLAVVLLSPAGLEWGAFIITGGKWYTPKGWPTISREWDKPTDPRELEAYEYAHALKLPDSLPKPVPFNFARYLLSSRRTTAEAYFDHLCATEAGEYIFKTVDKVEGIYQMRAMPKREDKVMTDRYAFEDPADWSQGEGNGSPYQFIGGPSLGFRYFESRRSPETIASRMKVSEWNITPSVGSPYWHYHHFDYTKPYGQVDHIQQIKSKYAYTWRGIRRENDRKHGIAGGEMIVLDLISGEILGVRRSFSIVREKASRISWEFSYYCPKNKIYRAQGRILKLNKGDYPYDFVSQVLSPIDFDPSKAHFNN